MRHAYRPSRRGPTWPRLDSPRDLAVATGLLALASLAALLSGYGFVSDHKALAVLPIVAVAGLALLLTAVTRFAWFVLLLLATRASTDILKFGSSDAGNTATNTVSGRGPDPTTLIGVLFLVCALLWLAATLYSGRQQSVSIVTVMLLGYGAAGALSVIGSNHVQASALQLARLLTAILMFVVLEQLITDRAMLRRVVTACFAALTIPLTVTFVGMATGTAAGEIKGGLTRLTGTFVQSNDYARFLTFLVLFGVAIQPYVKSRAKPYLTGLLCLSGVALVLTLTLGAIGTAFLGVVAIALMQRRTRLVVPLVVASIAAFATVPGLLGRISASTTTTEIGGAETGNSLAWRFEFWSSLLSVNSHNPITGVGLNATQFYSASAKQPHNDYLGAYVETGILGLTMYLGLMAAMLYATGRAVARTEPATFEWGVAVGALVVVMAFAVMSLAANVIQNTANYWCVLAITACACAVGRQGGLPRSAAVDEVTRPAEVGPSLSLHR